MTNIIPATEEAIRQAAQTIRNGGLVAFPTETVYGLGANALDPSAVQKIFAAKGRPAANPLIVHIARPEDLPLLAQSSERAEMLISRFWPGPLTLVLPKSPRVPDSVTAGGPTVAVRMPRHPVALALIRASGVPLAAPSANRSEQLSPTRAEHVAESLGDAVGVILDGGPTEVGLESTVLDMTAWPPRLLRPGMVTVAEIEEAIGFPLSRALTGQGAASRSPGQMPRHYAPKTPLRITTNAGQDIRAAGQPVAFLACGGALPPQAANLVCARVLPKEPHAYAAGLYDTLHALDRSGAALLLIQAVPETDDWLAIRDRLTRAAAPQKQQSQH